MPRVTVCIPTYDRPRWLGAAIESVLAQRFEDFRLEIHDDASPGTAVKDLVARYDDPRIAFVAHERNAGIVGNFTRSLLGADGEYVLQLGDDDEMHPELLETTVAALDRHPSAGLAHTGFDLIDDAGAVRHAAVDWTGDGAPALETGAAFVRASMLHGCRVCSSTALIRRSAVPPGAFLQQDFPPFDFACWLRMADGLGLRVRAAAAVPLSRARAQPLLGRLRRRRRRLRAAHRDGPGGARREAARGGRRSRAHPARPPRPRARPAGARAHRDRPGSKAAAHAGRAGAGRADRARAACATRRRGCCWAGRSPARGSPRA